MKVSGEGYRSFAADQILTVRSSSNFSCIGGSDGLYSHYHRRPNVERDAKGLRAVTVLY